MRSNPYAVIALVFILMASVIPGCGGEAADARPEPAETAAPPPPAVQQDAAAALTDPQIAHVAVTANAIDIEMARLVDARTRHPGVRGFAQTMITDHTALNERAAALAQRLGVTPEENPVSRSLQEDADSVRERLTGLRGEAFDRAYMEREVAYHQAVLDALDQTLVPGTTNEELRDLLREVRPAIVAHLEHARALRASMGDER